MLLLPLLLFAMTRCLGYYCDCDTGDGSEYLTALKKVNFEAIETKILGGVHDVQRDRVALW